MPSVSELTTNRGRAQLAGAPNIILVGFEHKLSRLRILVDYILSADFEEPITNRITIIQADPTSVDCNDESDRVNWLS